MLVKPRPHHILSDSQALALAIFVIFVYHLLRYVHPDIWEQIYCVYYMFLVPALVAVYFARKRPDRPVELTLFILYWIWIFISRLLNGDFFLTQDGDMVLNIGLSCVMLAVCTLLKGRDRQRFLDWISLAVCGFYSLLSLCGLYAVLFRKELYNPLTGGSLCGFWYTGGLARLQLLGKHANEVAVWFFLSFFLLMYLFFRHKSLLWRIPIVAAALMNYLNLCMTFSRSNRVAFSVCFSLLLVMVVIQRLSGTKRSRQLLAALGLLLILLPLSYKSFDLTAETVGKVSYELVDAKQKAVPDTPVDAEQKAEPDTPVAAEQPAADIEAAATDLGGYSDNRGFSDSGRLAIYKTIVPTMQQEPLRLLRGCLCVDVMKIANPLLPTPVPHYHNTFLQVLCIAGLPGLLLTLLICVLLAVKVIRLFFSDAPLEIKALTLLLIGLFIYNMLEVSLFVAADTRAFTAYIVAGAVIAYGNEIQGQGRIQRLYLEG